MTPSSDNLNYHWVDPIVFHREISMPQCDCFKIRNLRITREIKILGPIRTTVLDHLAF